MEGYKNKPKGTVEGLKESLVERINGSLAASNPNVTNPPLLTMSVLETKMNKLGYLVRDLKRSAEEAGLGDGDGAAAEPPAEAGSEPPLTPVTPVNASATPA